MPPDRFPRAPDGKRAGKRVRWPLCILKSKAHRVGSFEGPEDPKEALKIGLDEHDIPEAARWRYSVHPCRPKRSNDKLPSVAAKIRRGPRNASE